MRGVNAKVESMMSGEEAAYQENADRGCALFHALQEKSAHGIYDDAFLAALVDYRALFPASENFDIFYAQYALAHDSVTVALEAAERAYEKKKCSYEVWKLLIECYKRLGDKRKLLMIEGVASRVYRVPVDVPMERAELQDALALLSLAMGLPNLAPYVLGRARLGAGGVEAPPGVFLGEFLPSFTEPADGWRYWSGVFVDRGKLHAKAMLLERLKETAEFPLAEDDSFVFDILRARELRGSFVIEPAEFAAASDAAAKVPEIVVPLAGTVPKQKVVFQSRSVGEDSVTLGKWVTSFFRLNERTEIASDAPFILGKPIRLGHSPKRKKLVLHILIDALCWPEMKRRDFEPMPNLMRFFSKGVIFNNHYSVAEYTFPSLATIETGVYAHRSQVFNPTCMAELSPQYVTLAEQMAHLGYYCVNTMGDATGVYPQVTRGYERLLLVHGDAGLAYQGAERTVQTMRAFSECDPFIFLHLMDAHPGSAADFQLPLAAQVGLPLAERLAGAAEGVASVNLPHVPIYTEAVLEHMRSIDRSLGAVFDYIEANYQEDEYIVQVYSDHGVSVFSDDLDYIGENQTGAAWLLRGAGVPQLGLVEELTSALDIYPAAAHLVGFDAPAHLDGNLPKALGGREREFVVSNSLFPGQTYKLAIRTNTHEFRMESREPVDEDGTTDLREPKVQQLFLRGGERRLAEDEALQRKFLALARAHTAGIDTRGEIWREKRALRPLWFGGKGKEGEL